MKLSFRWFGDSDPVKLSYIQQIPAVSTVSTQVQASKIGDLISKEDLIHYVDEIEKNNMKFEIFESLPVHSSIKLATSERDHYIDNFKENIKTLASVGIKVISYNFRPIIRWARTDVNKFLGDGSSVSVFYKSDAERLNPFTHSIKDSKWYEENSNYIYKRQLTTDLKLDGYYTEESTKILVELRQKYQDLGREGLWNNLRYFLNEVIPVCESCGVRMAIHPDDPPWDIFDIPRLMIDEESIDKLISLYDSPSNGIVFCSGTYQSNSKNDVIKMAKKYLPMDRIPFAHIRNIKIVPDGMEECAHYSEYGSIDMVQLLKVFSDNNYKGYIRSDHGRMIWQESCTPGNGIYDRALGAQYILGIWETLQKLDCK